MKIRTAGSEDIPQLLQLYRQLNPDDIDTTVDDAQKNWELLQRYPGSNVFIGCVDDNIVTSCTLVVIPNLTRGGASYALIENVVTSTAHRKKGYGKAILNKAIDASWRANCYKVMLLTGSTLPATLNFYLDAGFEQTKTGFQIRRIPARLEANSGP